MPLLHPRARRLALAIAPLLLAACGGGPPYRETSLAQLQTPDGWYRFPEFSYAGPLNGGVPDGRGKVRYPGGATIEGTFTRGVPEGDATITAPGFGKIVGTMRDGVLVEGYATLENGDIYEGQFVAGYFGGKGALYRASGERYAGSFSGGRPHGNGTLFDARTGVTVHGQFEAGLPHGNATVRAANGTIERQVRERGRDVTDARYKEQAASAHISSVSAKLDELVLRATAERDRLAQVEQERSRLRNVRTPSGIEAFNKACACTMRASVDRDGNVHVGSDGCLIVTKRDGPKPTEEQKRLWEEREQAKGRMCSEWAQDIENPDIGARLASVDEQYRQRSEALASAEAARRQAAADKARLEREARQRQYDAEVAATAARMRAAENRRAAEEAERQRQACSSPSQQARSCFCKALQPPPTPPDPRRSRGSCQ